MRPNTIGVLCVFCFALAMPAQAQIGTFGNECNIVWTQNYGGPGGGPVGGSLIIRVYGPWKGARFAAPIPACTGVEITNVEPLYGYSMSGNLDDGIEVSFGECLPDYQWDILRVDYSASPTQGLCCSYPILPHPDFGQIELIDCNDQVVVPTWTVALNFTPMGYEGDCEVRFAFPAENPVPANGETDVALSVQLEWSQYGNVGCPHFGGDWFDIYFGTTADPPLVASHQVVLFQTYDVGSLEQATTYYWRIGGLRDGNPIESPVWSFTTTDPLATMQTTWGRVKALYRE